MDIYIYIFFSPPGYRFLISYVYCKYLLLLCDLPFNSYNGVFWLTEVHILKYYNESIVFAYGLCFVYNRK